MDKQSVSSKPETNQEMDCEFESKMKELHDKFHRDMVNYLDKVEFCLIACDDDGDCSEQSVPAMKIIRDATSKGFEDLFEFDEKKKELTPS